MLGLLRLNAVDLVWRWEQTPFQHFDNYVFRIREVPPERELQPQDKPLHSRSPLTGAIPQHSLPGTKLSFQVAVSGNTLNREAQAIRAAQPELSVSGDGRTGLVLFDGPHIIGSFLHSTGGLFEEDSILAVTRNYRGDRPEFGRLSQRILLEWQKRVMRTPTRFQERLYWWSVKPFLLAHRDLCQWAVDSGKPVPEAVRAELKSGAQFQFLLEKLETAKQTGWSYIVGT